MAKYSVIPKDIATKVPAKCPVCFKKCIAVFRTWKTNGNVSCEFLHNDGTSKLCRKTYLSEKIKTNTQKKVVKKVK